MGDYLDNDSNKNWEWHVNQETGQCEIEVDHGDHTHKLDLSETTIDELNDNTNQVLGDAHRESEHYPKNDDD